LYRILLSGATTEKEVRGGAWNPETLKLCKEKKLNRADFIMLEEAHWQENMRFI
jgi:hypothetical protein